MRKVFLENLPRCGRRIEWKKCIGIKVRFIYDNIEGWIKIVDYDNTNRLLYIQYEDNEPFKINIYSFQKCTLGKLLGVITDEFKIEIGTHFKDEKRDITIIDRTSKLIIRKNGYKENKKYYKYRCNKCGFECGEHYRNGEYQEEFLIEENNLLNGNSCACCYNRIAVPHINSIVANPKTHWMIKYFQGGYDEAKKYTRCSDIKIFSICPDCERVKDKEIKIADIYKTKSIGCTCGDGVSYPNKFMFNILEQLNTEFTNEYSPEWIGRKLYDFYVPSKNIIIEMDGGLGHGKKSHSKSNKSKEETKSDDDYKDLMADKYGIKVIRINCDESDMNYIKDNILESELIDYFDFSNIDWLRVEEFALSNRCKQACEIKRDNPNMSTVDIAKIIGSSKGIVRDYLKKGSKIWDWLNYDAKEEMKRAYEKSVKIAKEKCSKPLEIFKDGISLGIFESAMELSRQSESLFGIKLNNSDISKALRGERENYKGFTFKHASQSA